MDSFVLSPCNVLDCGLSDARFVHSENEEAEAIPNAVFVHACST